MILWDRPSSLVAKQFRDAARSIDDEINALDSGTRDKVVSACREANIPPEADRELLWQTVLLMAVQTEGRHRVKTPAERDKALAEVQACAGLLLDALRALGQENFYVDASGREVAKELPELERLMLGQTRPTPSILQIEILQSAVQRVRQTQTEKGSGGGRRKVLLLYAHIIDGIWDATKDHGLKVGRGGPFERLCKAVFDAAGVPSGAEGAVRYFKENLHTKRKSEPIALFEQPSPVGPLPE